MRGGIQCDVKESFRQYGTFRRRDTSPRRFTRDDNRGRGADGRKKSPEEVEQRRNLVAQMKAFGKRLESRHIDLGDLVIKGREELKERLTTRFQKD
jgi:hypothetical protein